MLSTLFFSLNMTAAQFDIIKKYILLKGDRQGFCNMYNDNPHMAFGNSDVYLNPASTGNTNCDPTKSDFNQIGYSYLFSAIRIHSCQFRRQ